jgi:predicted helicase
MLDLLEAQAIEKDTGTLNKFYESVKMRAAGIDNAEGKQRVIIELYDKFFKTAFPKMVEKLGIVYTPIEVVDFIIHSVNYVLEKEFSRNISDENVQLLDPFTGTGTFITRLLQSGLITKKDMLRKYQHEIHANEIVLLAYYIAAVNIENAFHDAIGAKDYLAFDGICLTDTFQLGETDESSSFISKMFPQNSERVVKQKKAPLRVIVGNPPYSIGQKSANDNAQNQSYPKLEEKISSTYANESSAGLNKSLYDPYIKAFRWGSDRLDPKNGGIVCFVSNGGWLDGNSADGFRKCLEKEFSSIYIFNLRGDARTQGELRRKEAGNVFGGGSRTSIAITLLVKKPKHDEKANIFYYDIGDYLSREDKLLIIKQFHSVANSEIKWKKLKPNEHGDWISQRNESFDTFSPIAPDKKFDLKTHAVFTTYAIGVASNRDAWVYNFSKQKIQQNMKRMIVFYNEQQIAYAKAVRKNPSLEVEDFIDGAANKIGWTRALRKDVARGIQHEFHKKEITLATYRPYTSQQLYFDRPFIESPGINPQFFPTSDTENFVINCHGLGGNKIYSVLITKNLVDLNCMEAGSQCFPLYYFEEREKQSPTLFDAADDNEFIRRDGISDFILTCAKTLYGKNISKEDIFYYVYGFLHSPSYRDTFAADLKKMLPRIPLVEEPRDFWKFSKAGRELAELHINYESVPAYENIKITGGKSGYYEVEKMRFPKKDQKDIIIYNSKIMIENIPLKAYEYVINGKSAIEWIMERYQISTHKESGIANDPNDWAKEVEKPRYILDLLLSIINVSMKTVRIVEGLPQVKFE